MENIKSQIFLYLTSRQKSQLLGTLKSYFKKFELNIEELSYKFLEDEKYYLDIGNPHFEFMKDYLDSNIFLKDMEKYFKFLNYEKSMKEKLKPYLEKQKELQKKQRKKAQDFKMSKQKPTLKQIKYYEKLCRAHNKEMKDLTGATKLNLRDWIMEIINEYN